MVFSPTDANADANANAILGRLDSREESYMHMHRVMDSLSLSLLSLSFPPLSLGCLRSRISISG